MTGGIPAVGGGNGTTGAGGNGTTVPGGEGSSGSGGVDGGDAAFDPTTVRSATPGTASAGQGLLGVLQGLSGGAGAGAAGTGAAAAAAVQLLRDRWEAVGAQGSGGQVQDMLNAGLRAGGLGSFGLGSGLGGGLGLLGGLDMARLGEGGAGEGERDGSWLDAAEALVGVLREELLGGGVGGGGASGGAGRDGSGTGDGTDNGFRSSAGAANRTDGSTEGKESREGLKAGAAEEGAHNTTGGPGSSGDSEGPIGVGAVGAGRVGRWRAGIQRAAQGLEEGLVLLLELGDGQVRGVLAVWKLRGLTTVTTCCAIAQLQPLNGPARYHRHLATPIKDRQERIGARLLTVVTTATDRRSRQRLTLPCPLLTAAPRTVHLVRDCRVLPPSRQHATSLFRPTPPRLLCPYARVPTVSTRRTPPAPWAPWRRPSPPCRSAWGRRWRRGRTAWTRRRRRWPTAAAPCGRAKPCWRR